MFCHLCGESMMVDTRPAPPESRICPPCKRDRVAARLRAENAALRERARRFYRADGTFDLLPNEEAVERMRIEAAKEIAALRERVAVLEGSRGAADIALERAEHRAKWSDAHDDEHGNGALAVQAAGLALPPNSHVVRDIWGLQAKYASDRRRRMVVAGALIAAEIDRLDRLAAAKPAENSAGGA